MPEGLTRTRRVDKDQYSHRTSPQPCCLVWGVLQEWRGAVILSSPIPCPASPRLQSPSPGPALGTEGPHLSRGTLAAPSPAFPPLTCFFWQPRHRLALLTPQQRPADPCGCSTPPPSPRVACFPPCSSPAPARSEAVYLHLIIDPHIYPANILSFSARGHFPSLPINPRGRPKLSSDGLGGRGHSASS